MPFPSETLDWARDGADWPNREASRFVKAAGLRWHVQDMGEGPAALLIHGVGGASHSWRDVAPLLAARFRVIAPDLPGHGFTAMPRRAGLSLPSMAQGLSELLHVLGVEARMIVGHSAGAAIGTWMALDGRAAPDVIVACNGAFMPFRGVAGQIFPPMAKMLAMNPFVPRAFAWSADRAAVDRLMKAMGSPLEQRGRALYRRLFTSPGHVAAALGMMAHWELRQLVAALPRLPCRLELVVGEADRAVPPADAAEVAALAPKAHMTWLPGLGHLAHEERPALIAEIAARAFDLAREELEACADSADTV